MKLFIGRTAVLLIICGGIFLTILNISSGFYSIALGLFMWTLIFVPLGFWTVKNPRKSFLVILVFYLVSSILRAAFLGGEHILSVLMHLYFIISMVIGASASKPFKNENK